MVDRLRAARQAGLRTVHFSVMSVNPSLLFRDCRYAVARCTYKNNFIMQLSHCVFKRGFQIGKPNFSDFPGVLYRLGALLSGVTVKPNTVCLRMIQ